MTHLLNEALDQLHRLPDADQDAIAALILEELQSEERWQSAFARSQDQLAALGQEARSTRRELPAGYRRAGDEHHGAEPEERHADRREEEEEQPAQDHPD